MLNLFSSSSSSQSPQDKGTETINVERKSAETQTGSFDEAYNYGPQDINFAQWGRLIVYLAMVAIIVSIAWFAFYTGAIAKDFEQAQVIILMGTFVSLVFVGIALKYEVDAELDKQA